MSQRPRLRSVRLPRPRLVAAALAGVILVTVSAAPYRVEQRSMERTLEPGAVLLVDRFLPKLTGVRRGDIIVFDAPGAAPGDPPFVKRVVGLAGETVDIRDGRVWIDGRPLDEAYVYDGEPTRVPEGAAASMPAGSSIGPWPPGTTGTTRASGAARRAPSAHAASGGAERGRAGAGGGAPAIHLVVPPGSVYVLGDHRSMSADSRVFGPVAIDRLIGRVWLEAEPNAIGRLLAGG